LPRQAGLLDELPAGRNWVKATKMAFLEKEKGTKPRKEREIMVNIRPQKTHQQKQAYVLREELSKKRRGGRLRGSVWEGRKEYKSRLKRVEPEDQPSRDLEICGKSRNQWGYKNVQIWGHSSSY